MIIWIVFMIMSFILIYVGLNRGFAKSFISFLVNLFNAVLAFIIARIFVNSTAIKFGKEVIKTISDKYSSDLTNMAVVETFAKFGMSVIIGVLTFYIFYIILHIINSFIKPVLFYGSIADKIKFESKVATVAISILSTALTLMIFVTPIGVIFNSVVPTLTGQGISKVPFVSTTFFDKLTEIPDNKNDIKTSDEVKYTANTAMAAYNIAEGKNEEQDNVELFRKNFERSYFLPTVIADVGSTAAKQWKDGNEFFGAKADIPEGREGELTIKFLDIVAGWNKKEVVNDVNTVLDLVKVVKDYGPEKFESEDGLVTALAEDTFIEDTLVVLYGNKDFASLIPPVLEYGLCTAFDALGVEMEEEYTSNIDVSKMSEEDVRREGRIVSGIIRAVFEIVEANDKIENGELTENDIEKIVDEFSKLKDSKVLGDIANELVYQLSVNLATIQF